MTDSLKQRLTNCNPSRVVVTLADDTKRELKPAAGTRKRWLPILEPLAKLEWVRAELFDRGGTTLAIVDNPDIVEEEEAPPVAADQMDRAMQRMIAAQREALSWQDKSVRSALDTCVQVMRELGSAVATLSKVHQMQLDNMMTILKEGAGADQGGDGIASTPLVTALMPAIVGKLMAPPPIAPSKPQNNNGSNGANGHG